MLLYLPEHLYNANKALVDEYQAKANKLIENETLYKNLVSYVTEGIDAHNYAAMQEIWQELYDKLYAKLNEEDKKELYICFNEEEAVNMLEKCNTAETKLYCLYVIITNSNDPDKYIVKFEEIYNSLDAKEINSLSERIILAHYLNDFIETGKRGLLPTYPRVLKYIKSILNDIPEKFKTEYFYKILKHHIIQYLPAIAELATNNAFANIMLYQDLMISQFKKFRDSIIELLAYEDYQYSYHYMRLSLYFDSVLLDLSTHHMESTYLKEYINHFKEDQRRAFMASNSHNYDSDEFLVFVKEYKDKVPELYTIIYGVLD